MSPFGAAKQIWSAVQSGDLSAVARGLDSAREHAAVTVVDGWAVTIDQPAGSGDWEYVICDSGGEIKRVGWGESREEAMALAIDWTRKARSLGWTP